MVDFGNQLWKNGTRVDGLLKCAETQVAEWHELVYLTFYELEFEQLEISVPDERCLPT